LTGGLRCASPWVTTGGDDHASHFPRPSLSRAGGAGGGAPCLQDGQHWPLAGPALRCVRDPSALAIGGTHGRHGSPHDRWDTLVVLQVDRAHRSELEQVLRIADARRQQYVRYQPQFWRPAPDAVDRQRAFFASLLESDEVCLRVARERAKVHGFVLARLVDAPPVHEPGGQSCVVDDFAVADPADWQTAGPMLLDAVREWGVSNGATQIVAVVAQLDEAKRAVLRSSRLTVASEWWVGPI